MLQGPFPPQAHSVAPDAGSSAADRPPRALGTSPPHTGGLPGLAPCLHPTVGRDPVPTSQAGSSSPALGGPPPGKPGWSFAWPRGPSGSPTGGGAGLLSGGCTRLGEGQPLPQLPGGPQNCHLQEGPGCRGRSRGSSLPAAADILSLLSGSWLPGTCWPPGALTCLRQTARWLLPGPQADGRGLGWLGCCLL